MCFLVFVSRSDKARAESGDYNIHLEIGPGFAVTGWQADELGVGVFGAAKFELAVIKWLGIDVGGGHLQFFKGGHPPGYKPIDAAYWTNGCIGVRFRLFNDESGFLWPWRKTPDHAGNLWGNLWIDLHGDYYYTGDLNRFGADIGLGAELSLVNGLQMGPFARIQYVFQKDSGNERDSDDAWILLAGLSFSISIPTGAKKQTDNDRDGIFNPVDICPDDPEDSDGFEDDDGCPDPDNDEDGIGDREDRCPLSPEDRDGVEDGDGCPDMDNDGDKIPDDRDNCPDDPEDLDGFQDDDGCPDKDNDGDGVPDEVDMCRDEKETYNKIEDEDGCPESDSDHDGFVDNVDQCPNDPETVNGVEDDDGCPDQGLVEVKEDKILLGERVYFDFGMARIKHRSKKLLEHLANLIATHPEYLVVSIEGHADSKGPVEFNLKLSRKRADRVKKYLMDLGISPDRLVTKGFGEANPWTAAEDEGKMEKNRRVELMIMEIDESLAVTPMAKKIKDAVHGADGAENSKIPLEDWAAPDSGVEPEDGPDE
jgi:outer membrane protein OmpA-like peptidoglycan-associated protein